MQHRYFTLNNINSDKTVIIDSEDLEKVCELMKSYNWKSLVNKVEELSTQKKKQDAT